MAATSATELTLGTTTAAGPAAAAAARSSACHSVSRPLTRMVSSRRPYSPDGDGGADPVAGLGLGVGGDGVLEVEDERVGGEALGLLEGPLVGAGHVEDGAAGAERSSVIVRPPAGEAVGRGQLGVAVGQLLGQVDHDVALLDRGVVLHLPVDHHGAGAVAHGLDDLQGVGHVGRVGGEHLLGDVDLHRVEAPGADAAEQEGVAELVLAGDDVLDVAERAVEREDPVGRAGVDHAGDRVVPEVLLVGGAAGRRGRRRSGPGGPGSRGGRRRRGWSSCGGWRPGRPGRATGPACGGWRRRSPRRWPRRGPSRGWRARGSARCSPALASSWASRRST